MRFRKTKATCPYVQGDIVYMINSRFVSRAQKFSFLSCDDKGIAKVQWVKVDGSLGAVWETPLSNLCIGWAF